jgi:hypothetical protein
MVRPLSFAVSQAEKSCQDLSRISKGVLTGYLSAILITHAVRPVKTIVELNKELHGKQRTTEWGIDSRCFESLPCLVASS